MQPASGFNAKVDAEALHKAMKGLGTNEKALINVLCHRSVDQRVQIAHAFKEEYEKVNAFFYRQRLFVASKTITIPGLRIAAEERA